MSYWSNYESVIIKEPHHVEVLDPSNPGQIKIELRPNIEKTLRPVRELAQLKSRREKYYLAQAGFKSSSL
jgi:hypothetical protein